MRAVLFKPRAIPKGVGGGLSTPGAARERKCLDGSETPRREKDE